MTLALKMADIRYDAFEEGLEQGREDGFQVGFQVGDGKSNVVFGFTFRPNSTLYFSPSGCGSRTSSNQIVPPQKTHLGKFF